jgi:hypothetical protein
MSITAIATKLGIAGGSVSNATRDLPKPARATVAVKGAAKSRREGETIADIKPDQELVAKVNERRLLEEDQKIKRLQDEAEAQERHKREMQDLEKRKVELEVLEREARLKAVNSPDPANLMRVEQFRDDRDKLDKQLTEMRFQMMLDASERARREDNETTRRLIADGQARAGRSAYDLLDKGIDKIENIAMMGGAKIDGFIKSQEQRGNLGMAISLGLTPEELDILKRGVETPWTRAQYEQVKGSRSEADFGTYEFWLERSEEHNRRYSELSARVGRRLAQGSRQPQTQHTPRRVLIEGGDMPIRCEACGELSLVSPDILAKFDRATCSACGGQLDLGPLKRGKQPPPPGQVFE